MSTTTRLDGRIHEDLIELFQRPPHPHEGMGQVDPFTDHERAAIARYNEQMSGIDGMFDVHDDAALLDEQTDEHGFTTGVYHAMSHARQLLDALSDWYGALDELHNNIAEYATMSGAPSHSNAADRLLRFEAHELLSTADSVRHHIVKWLLGHSGPHENGMGGLTMSNGVINATPPF